MGGGIDYERYLKYTNKLRPFDKSVPEDLSELISRMLKNKPEERIDWVQFYGCKVLNKYDEGLRLFSFKGEY